MFGRSDEEQVMKDFSSAAAGFFASTRAPAVILSGTTLGALFALGNFSKQAGRSLLELIIVKAYRLLTWTSFILSLNANIICTMVATKMLHQDFDPLAETPHALLKREFALEFMNVQWSMTVSLLLFVAIVTIRLMLEMNLLTDPERRDTCIFVGLSAVALSCHMLSYVNESLNGWDHLGDLTVELFESVLHQAWYHPTILRSISLLSAACSVLYGIKSAVSPSRDKSKTKSE